ncbi:MAG: LptA/OstA family protein [Opitutales bacterium]
MNFYIAFTVAIQAFCLLGIATVSAQLEQATAIRDFTMPRFDDEGRRLWTLSGKEFKRVAPDEAIVRDMDLRTYAADRQKSQETRMRSPSARFFLQENRAESEQSIRIDGLDYEITGHGWKWIGEKNRVIVENRVRVVFDAPLTDFLATGCDSRDTDHDPVPQQPSRPLPDDEGKTRIFSDKLELLTTDKDHQFHFFGNVRIIGRNLTVSCDQLKVFSQRSSDEGGGPGAFGSISKILATGRVRIEQKERSAVAGKATIDVLAGTIVLEENPVVFDDRGKATGHKIILYRGQRRAEVQGKPGETRAKVTLPPLRDLDVFGKDANQTKAVDGQTGSEDHGSPR